MPDTRTTTLGAIRVADVDDAEAVAALVQSLSGYYLSPGATELPDWFAMSITPQAFVERFANDDFDSFVCVLDQEIVAYLSIKQRDHLYHLFVAETHQRKGMAKSLWQYATARLNIAQCMVRSSLFAVPIYERLGFSATEPVAFKDDIGFQVMRLEDQS